MFIICFKYARFFLNLFSFQKKKNRIIFINKSLSKNKSFQPKTKRSFPKKSKVSSQKKKKFCPQEQSFVPRKNKVHREKYVSSPKTSAIILTHIVGVI